MGLREALQKATVAAFNGLGDIPESVTFRSMASGAPAYDPAIGSVTETYTDYTVLMVFTRVKQHEISVSANTEASKTGDKIEVRASDTWALIPKRNLTPTPKMIDVIIKNGETWKLADVRTDPAEALWKLLIRKA